jgi:hypothetical protein
VIIEVRLQHTYSVAGGELATPIREFEDAAGTPWLESIFANGHAKTIERHSKCAFLSMVLQEVQ